MPPKSVWQDEMITRDKIFTNDSFDDLMTHGMTGNELVTSHVMTCDNLGMTVATINEVLVMTFLMSGAL